MIPAVVLGGKHQEGSCARAVGGSGAVRDGLPEKVGHASSKGSERGSGVGEGAAAGADRLNSCMRKRERASAIVLYLPGTCRAETVKLPRAARKNMLRRRAIRWGEWEVPERTHATTAWLSQANKTFLVAQRWPHTKAAMTMG